MIPSRFAFVLLAIELLIINGVSNLPRRPESQPPVQQTTPAPVSTAETDKVEMLSPYELERIINWGEKFDLKEICGRLKIAEGLQIEEACDAIPNACQTQHCRAISLNLHFSDNFGVDEILELRAGSESAYLFFKRDDRQFNKSDWELVGYCPITSVTAAEIRLERGENQGWIVIRERWGSGSGVYLGGERWMALIDGKLKDVLSYPVTGHDGLWGPGTGRGFRSWVTFQGLINKVPAITVQFAVTYGENDTEVLLFTKKQKATFIWNERAKKFVLDPATSDLSMEEMNAVYNYDSLSNEQLLDYNYDELYDLAKSGSPEQKKWLKEFLGGLENSTKKQGLERLIKQN